MAYQAGRLSFGGDTKLRYTTSVLYGLGSVEFKPQGSKTITVGRVYKNAYTNERAE